MTLLYLIKKIIDKKYGFLYNDKTGDKTPKKFKLCKVSVKGR